MKENLKKVLFPYVAILLFAIPIFIAYWVYKVPSIHTVPTHVTTTSWNCPTGYPVKGNLHSMIYHMPGWEYYDRTNAANSICFDTPADAEADGFRASYR